MIINEAVSSPVISNILAAPTRFKIKASAKAFKILSGFYSEPILAIPRELGANAWDSHVKAGNTSKMFEVHAPNTLEPWFSIRDFGTGLSPEAIDTIYTTYFESTKTGDNDSDGCMGLGSKTPFNYTDNFNVTSFQNGKKYVYNCFIDETGSPNIMQIATADTTEQNGLEIKFGVKIADIAMWVEKITRAYEPFRHRPTIKGAKIEYKPREYIYEGKKWAMRKNDDHNYYNRGCNAFMGNYCYPINATAFRNILYTEKLDSALNYGNFDLFFDIGELEVAPNKEQLQYEDNNSTTTAIIAALKNAVAELKTLVNKSVETPKTLWEAMYLYNKYNSYNSYYSHIRNVIGEIPIKYKNSHHHFGNEAVASVHKHAGCLSDDGSLDHYRLHVLDTLNGKIKSTGTYHPHSDTRDVRIFYTNSTVIKKSRLRHYLNTTYASGKMPTCFIITDASEKNETFFKHAKYFGWDDSMITNIEALPKPPAGIRQKKTASTDEILVSDISGLINFYKDKSKTKNYRVDVQGFKRQAATFDANTIYYYVDFLYTDPMWKDKSMGNYIDGTIKLFVQNNLQGDATKIYGINKKNQSLLKVGTWINVFDIVKAKIISAQIKTFENDLYMAKQYDNYINYQQMYNVLTSSPSFIANIKSNNTEKLFTEFINSYTQINKKYSEVDQDLLLMYGVSSKCHIPLTCDINSFKNILINKYMNVTSLLCAYQTEHFNTVYNIINFIDEKS